MARVYNFSAGPSMLPEQVLRTAQAEMLDYHGSGQSVMEMSHRSKWFEEIIQNTEASLRRLMQIPDNYKIGFFQGGATQQFAMVPLNLMTTGQADYIVTGNFSNLAAKEAAKFGQVNVVASSKDKNFTYIPDVLHRSPARAAGILPHGVSRPERGRTAGIPAPGRPQPQEPAGTGRALPVRPRNGGRSPCVRACPDMAGMPCHRRGIQAVRDNRRNRLRQRAYGCILRGAFRTHSTHLPHQGRHGAAHLRDDDRPCRPERGAARP